MYAGIFQFGLLAIVAVGIMVLLVTLLPVLYDYEITAKDLRIKLLRRWPCRCLPLKDIMEIRKVSFRETLPFRSIGVFFAERWGNRLFQPIVLIRRERGFTKIWFLTPKEPDAFITDIKSKVQKLEKQH